MTAEDDLLRRLADIEEIKGLTARYFRYLDTQWWAEIRGLFCDDCIFDLTRALVDPGTEWTGTPLPPMTSDSMVADLSERCRGTVSVRPGHIPEVEILSATTARGVWALHDIVVSAPGSSLTSFVGCGHYHEERRKEDVCKVSSLRVTRLRIEPAPGADAASAGVAQ